MSNFTDGNRLHQILTTVLFLKLISSPLACCPRRVLERGGGDSTQSGAFLLSVAPAKKASAEPGGENLKFLHGCKAVAWVPKAQQGSSLPWSESNRGPKQVDPGHWWGTGEVGVLHLGAFHKCAESSTEMLLPWGVSQPETRVQGPCNVWHA